MKYVNTSDVNRLNELLDKACSLLISLEEYAMDLNPEYTDTFLAAEVNDFFKQINAENEDLGPEYDSAGFTEEDRIVDGQYRTYVDTVKQNINKATEEGILRCDDSEGYNYMSKETWLRMQADQQAQDWDIFGEKKV